MGSEAKLEAIQIINSLRRRDIKADCDHCERSLKAQLKFANKLGCGYVVIVGDEELRGGKLKLKDMRDGNEQHVGIDNAVDFLAGILEQ